MHRGSHHYGIPYDSSYSRRGYGNEDNMIEIVQQFREFKPYLKKRLAYIKQAGRALELHAEVEDIEFYLEVMKDILADESHGVDQLRSYIDKIHEMIRKNPLTDLPATKRRSLDGNEDEYGDNDRPRSPSPETRASDAAANIPLIPTHNRGAHRTVEVDFSSRNEHGKSQKKDDTYDEWGRQTFENSFTRREPYKDVDMRGGYYPSSAIGRGQRRWSEEGDFGGARGVGRGMGIGRGAPVPHHRKDDYRKDLDNRHSSGRGYYDNDYDRRNDFHDRSRPRGSSKERERDFKPDWLTGGPSNGNKFDEWQPKTEHRDTCFRTDVDRRPSNDEWRKNHHETRERDEKYHHAQHIAKYFERRPSSDTRREDRSDDYGMYGGRSRNERQYESTNTRHEVNNSHSDYNHGRRGPHGHNDFHGRGRKDEDRHEARSRMDGGTQYPIPSTAPSLMNPMNSISITPKPVSMAYGVQQPPSHYTNSGGLLPPPSSFPNINPPLLPLPVPNSQNAGMSLGVGPPIPPGVPHSMGFQQPPPPTPNYHIPDMHTNTSIYRMPPPPPQTRPPATPVPPSTIRPSPPATHHPSEQYQGVPSGSPNYTSPGEPSAEQVREITMMKAKQCFGRVVSRPSSTQPTPGPSTSATVSPGTSSPNNGGNDNQKSCGLDPRLNRARAVVHQTVQNRQHSPPASNPDHPRASTSSRSDAGNVLRPTSDPRARNRQEEERKRIKETKERMRQLEIKSNNSKSSKIQELRKQFEKEGFHRLGRPAHKKQIGSFEDAITITYDEESGKSSPKPGDKSKSSTFSLSKDKDGDSGRQSRSQTDKTEKERSPKRKSGERNKAKEKTDSKSTNDADTKRDKESTNEKVLRKKSGPSEKTHQTGDKNAPHFSKAVTSSGTTDITGSTEKTIDPTKPPSFKIPRKPKPKEPEVEPHTVSDEHIPDVREKDICHSPPASPEPALSQVPDAESRTESVEDAEQPSSSKPTTDESSNRSDVNPNALEYFKQFLMTSADPEERDFILANPDNLKQLFVKIKSEISAAKGSRTEESGSTQTTTETEQDKQQPPDDVQERGRSREKKRNTKRRSSLEKLHDALKEMRFDTMLPLGPRRCTRGGQEEAVTETVEPELPVTVEPTKTNQEEPKEQSVVDKVEEDNDKTQPTRKRGRPPKESPKGKKNALKSSPTEEESEVETPEPETPEVTPAETKSPVRRGKKRKLKPAKGNPRKRTKKSGPITRAQAALKKQGKDTSKNVAAQSEEGAAKEGVTTRKKNKTTNNVVLRRLTRKRVVGSKDTVVNKGLCKIKLETDFATNVKTELADADPFIGAGSIESSNEQSYLADQLANIINENLDNDVVANLERQTEENMDLDVFNTLDGDDNSGEACVKDELDVSLPEEIASDISFEESTSETSSTSSKKSAKVKPVAPPPPVISFDDSVDSVSSSPFQDESPFNPPTPILEIDQTSNSTVVIDNLSETSKEDILVIASFTNANIAKHEKECNIALALNDDDVVTRKGSSSSKSLRKSSEKKENLPINEDDSTNTSSSSSGSSTSTFNTDSSEEVRMKTEEMHSTPELADLDEIRKDVFSNKCDKCNFTGKKIVSHYVNKHYPCNIPQARLMPETFNGLIELNTSESPQLLEIVLDESQTLVWPCLYCDDRYNCIVDFYDHLTSHTGEFRYECGECGTSYPHHKSLLNHVKNHKGVSKNCIRFTFESVIEKSSKELSGFLCNDCFYFQLRFESIIRHIEQTGHSSLDVKSVRLIRPSALSDIESTSGTNDVKIHTHADSDVNVTDDVEQDAELEESRAEQDEVWKTVEDTVDQKENEEVFFGTNVNFTPANLPSGACTFAVPRVFKERFLEDLMNKITINDESENSTVKSEADGSRKRKRDSFHEAEEKSATKKSNTKTDVTSGTLRPRGVKLRKTHSKPKTLLDWDDSDDGLSDELNDFLLSSDDDVDDESDWSDIDETKKKTSDDPCIQAVLDAPDVQNNDDVVKSLVLRKMDKYDEKYIKKHDLVTVRRPGDLYQHSAVLYGYVKAGLSLTAPHRLRDHKEVDKLCHISGARVLPVKCAPKYREMLHLHKLTHLFKCMSTVCSYSTNVSSDFLEHLTDNHFTNVILIEDESCSRFLPLEDIVVMKDADCCSYCSARFREARHLVDHIITQHSQSLFQCRLCFYRSIYHRYVVRHFELEHPGANLDVLKCPQVVVTSVEEATLFQIFVYKCCVENPKCDKTKRYVFREDFAEHLRECLPDKQVYPCHLCKTDFTMEELLQHYKKHNLFKFHCSYCAYGSEVKADLDEHFVSIHPNTSGRVFYRVKQHVTPSESPVRQLKKRKKFVTVTPASPEDIKLKTDSLDKDGFGLDNQSGADTSGMDVSENEDNEKGRVTNLRGRDLYRCVTGDCLFIGDDSESFKEHVNTCTYVAESRSLSCAHCERKMKTATNLLEHMKVHGEKKQVCSLCSFRCWTGAEITKHVKTVHRVLSHKIIKKDLGCEDIDPDFMAYPKDVMTKSICTIGNFSSNYYSFAKKALYSFENIDKLPLNKVFSSDLHCAMCPYSTKVRSNIIRHLNIHKQALEDGETVVPEAPRINPVPYLSRDSLEFDKMMNLAASSHKTDGGTTTEADLKKLPQFVKEQFRYVCSVCDHITSDDALLQTHIKVIHSEVSTYKCPHCQQHDGSNENPDNTVPLDKIAFHLRLHGPKLYKCGHCMVVHHQLRLMEKHIPEKHPEKKPIHYLIRDVDPDGAPSSRPSSSGLSRRQSTDDLKPISTEKWKCFLCSSKSIFGSWSETRTHCEIVHKVSYQFMCLVCRFTSDEVPKVLLHCREKCKDENKKKKILVMFSKCETFDAEDASQTAPVWKRNSGPVRHIHGNFTEDSVALIRQYNNQQIAEQLPVTASSPIRGASSISLPPKPTSSTTSKARRSIAGPAPSKSSPVKTAPVPGTSSPQKSEIFKYRCHKCDMYRTKHPHELRIHLFNEFRYKRWMCLVCHLKFTTEKSLKGHIERDHQKVYQQDLYELQPENIDIEGEIDECIEKQNRKKDMINSFSVEKFGKLTCKHCNEDGYTYDTFETHILQKHTS